MRAMAEPVCLDELLLGFRRRRGGNISTLQGEALRLQRCRGSSVRNLALLPASVVTLVYICCSFVAAQLAALPEPSPWTGLIPVVAIFLFLAFWLQDAFLIAEESRPPETRRKPRGWLPFALPPVLVAGFAADALPPPLSSTLKPVALVFGVLLYFALIYRAAVAIVRAEGKVSGGTPFFNAALAAWFSLAFLPLGAWIVRPRLERLAWRRRVTPTEAP